jgi:hypothetical protein
MGLFDDGIPQNTTYAMELTTALAEMQAPAFAPGSSVLEIGSGIGRLVPWFLKGGMSYTALEPDRWAARYIRDARVMTMSAGTVTSHTSAGGFSLQTLISSTKKSRPTSTS